MTHKSANPSPQGAQLKRYTYRPRENGGATFTETDNGIWCEWKDVAPLAERIAALEREREEFKQEAEGRRLANADLRKERDAAVRDAATNKSHYEMAIETIHTQQEFLQVLANDPQIRGRVLEMMGKRDATRSGERGEGT